MSKRFERMVKCLELSASPNDAEALAAIRAANKIREELGLKWFDLAVRVKAAAPTYKRASDDFDFEPVPDLFTDEQLRGEEPKDPWTAAAWTFERKERGIE